MKAGVFSGKDRQRQMDGVGDICYSSYVWTMHFFSFLHLLA
jgi:hypothetical protein